MMWRKTFWGPTKRRGYDYTQDVPTAPDTCTIAYMPHGWDGWTKDPRPPGTMGIPMCSVGSCGPSGCDQPPAILFIGNPILVRREASFVRAARSGPASFIGNPILVRREADRARLARDCSTSEAVASE